MWAALDVRTPKRTMLMDAEANAQGLSTVGRPFFFFVCVPVSLDGWYRRMLAGNLHHRAVVQFNNNKKKKTLFYFLHSPPPLLSTSLFRHIVVIYFSPPPLPPSLTASNNNNDNDKTPKFSDRA